MKQVQVFTIPFGITLCVFGVIGVYYIYTVQLPNDKADVLDAVKFSVNNFNWSCQELQDKIDFNNKQWIDQDTKNQLNTMVKNKMESMNCK